MAIEVHTAIRADEETYVVSCESRLCRANGSWSWLIRCVFLGSDAPWRREVSVGIISRSVCGRTPA